MTLQYHLEDMKSIHSPSTDTLTKLLVLLTISIVVLHASLCTQDPKTSLLAVTLLIRQMSEDAQETRKKPRRQCREHRTRNSSRHSNSRMFLRQHIPSVLVISFMRHRRNKRRKDFFFRDAAVIPCKLQMIY